MVSFKRDCDSASSYGPPQVKGTHTSPSALWGFSESTKRLPRKGSPSGAPCSSVFNYEINVDNIVMLIIRDYCCQQLMLTASRAYEKPLLKFSAKP